MAPRGDSPRVTPMRELPDDSTVSPQPPRNIEAEQALLGALFVNNLAYERVSDFLSPEHFYNDVHSRIYEAIGRLIARGRPANPVTLKNLFDQDGSLVEIGGAQYLARLLEGAVTVINAEHYGRTIHDLHLRRELITIGQDVVASAFRHDLDDPGVAQIERAEQQLCELASSGQIEGGFTSLGQGLKTHIDAKKSCSNIALATGFIDLDRRMDGGLWRSDLIILAARPSMGKSGLAMNIATKVAGRGVPVGFFSFEMPKAQLFDRILAGETKIPLTRIRQRKLDEHEFQLLAEHERRLSGFPLHIDDSSALSIGTMRTRARRLKRQNGLGLVIVDYLQLVRPTERNRNYGRVQEIGEITQGLKAIAKDLDVPVLALSQLSRAVEQRVDNRPMLSDLRESGNIEQDADVVMFLFREEYYLAREPKADPAKLESVRNLAEVIVAKQRQGPIGTERLRFEHEITTFANYADRASDGFH